jgi:hypothetical protein
MNPVGLYEEVARKFPALWPSMPQWTWVNVHDGETPKLDLLADLLERHIATAEVVVVVHATPGTAAKISIREVIEHLAPHILMHEIQVSDPGFERFLSVSLAGTATCDA